MQVADRCLICSVDSLQRYRAMFAPFVGSRIWGRTSVAIRLMKCRQCDFMFSDSRFDPDEERRLYDGYRGRGYQALREKYEPWYTAEFNARLSTGTMEKRRARLAEIFREHLPSGIKSVLDFGGDRGDLFAGLLPGAQTFVYDISGVEPASGVKVLHTVDECTQVGFDLVGCSNVLEHVAFPRNLTSDLHRIASPSTLVFVEVPSENPMGMRTYAKRAVQEMWLLFRRPTTAASMLPFRFLRQVHEHINFFSMRALEALMQSSGFAVLASGQYPGEGCSFGPYKIAAGNVVWCLAKKGPDQNIGIAQNGGTSV